MIRLLPINIKEGRFFVDYRHETIAPLIVAVTGVSLCGLIVWVYLFVLVCVVYLFLYKLQIYINRMCNVLYGHNMSILILFRKNNEENGSTWKKYCKYTIVIFNHCHMNQIHRMTLYMYIFGRFYSVPIQVHTTRSPAMLMLLYVKTASLSPKHILGDN